MHSFGESNVFDDMLAAAGNPQHRNTAQSLMRTCINEAIGTWCGQPSSSRSVHDLLYCSHESTCATLVGLRCEEVVSWQCVMGYWADHLHESMSRHITASWFQGLLETFCQQVAVCLGLRLCSVSTLLPLVAGCCLLIMPEQC